MAITDSLQSLVTKPRIEPELPDETPEMRMQAVREQANPDHSTVYGGLQEDSMGAYIFNKQASGEWSKEQTDEVLEAFDEVMTRGTQGAGAAAAMGAGDLTAFATTLLYNAYNVARGHDWAWPEDMRNVPATSDWLAAEFGLPKEVTDSLAFIGGGIAIAPSKTLNDLDSKLIAKGLRTAKAIGGSKRAALARQSRAAELFDNGKEPEEIWQETGWWPYTDDAGKTTYKFYISDADAVYKEQDILAKGAARFQQAMPDAQVGDQVQVQMRMDEALGHDAMYELYPEVGGYPIMVWVEKTADGYKIPELSDGALASWNPAVRKFQLKGTQRGMSPRESLLHEAQHAIQTLEGWQDGASRGAMVSSAQRYQTGVMMQDVYKDPEKWIDLDEFQWQGILDSVGLDEGESQVLLKEITSVLEGTEDADRIAYWNAISSQAGREATRWLATAVHMGDDELQFIQDLDPSTLNTLAYMRYRLDLGEMEARLVEALSNVPQKAMDEVPMTPHDLMQMQQHRLGTNALESLLGMKPMREPAPIGDAITGVSRGKIEQRGLMDTQNLPETVSRGEPGVSENRIASDPQANWHAGQDSGRGDVQWGPSNDVPNEGNLISKFPEGTHQIFTEDEMKLLQNVVDNDPDLMRRILEGLESSSEVSPPKATAAIDIDTITKDYKKILDEFSDVTPQRIAKNQPAAAALSNGVNDVYLTSRAHGVDMGKIRLEVMKNPTISQLKRWKIPKVDGEPLVRVITDVEGNHYVWPADLALHDDFVKATGIVPHWGDDWTDVDGIDLMELVSMKELGLTMSELDNYK